MAPSKLSRLNPFRKDRNRAVSQIPYSTSLELTVAKHGQPDQPDERSNGPALGLEIVAEAEQAVIE
jgi:hypothetical protein